MESVLTGDILYRVWIYPVSRLNSVGSLPAERTLSDSMIDIGFSCHLISDVEATYNCGE